MKNYLLANLLLAGIGLLIAGCSKEKTTSAAAVDLEKAFARAAPQPAPARAEANASTVQGDEVKQAVDKAVVALRANDYADAFSTLHAVQAAPNLTLSQYSAIESARLAVEREMAVKADAGDPAALKALEKIKKIGH